MHFKVQHSNYVLDSFDHIAVADEHDTHAFAFPMHERAKSCSTPTSLLRLRLEFLVNYVNPLEVSN